MFIELKNRIMVRLKIKKGVLKFVILVMTKICNQCGNIHTLISGKTNSCPRCNLNSI